MVALVSFVSIEVLGAATCLPFLALFEDDIIYKYFSSILLSWGGEAARNSVQSSGRGDTVEEQTPLQLVTRPLYVSPTDESRAKEYSNGNQSLQVERITRVRAWLAVLGVVMEFIHAQCGWARRVLKIFIRELRKGFDLVD